MAGGGCTLDRGRTDGLERDQTTSDCGVTVGTLKVIRMEQLQGRPRHDRCERASGSPRRIPGFGIWIGAEMKGSVTMAFSFTFMPFFTNER